MASGGQIRTASGKSPAPGNWARVIASWVVVFFIVATWSILFRAVSPLLFGSNRNASIVLKMNAPTPGYLCVAPLGPGLADAISEGRQCDVVLAASPP